MIKLLFSFILFLVCVLTNAQTSVYGIYTDDNAPYDDYTILAKVNPVTGLLLGQDTIHGYDAVALGSSSFDQLSGNYIYNAAGNNGFSLLSRNVYSNSTVSEVSTDVLANALQFDMASGNTYGLGSYVVDSVLMDPSQGWWEYTYGTTFLSLDINTGFSTLINELPEVNAIVLGASCFDPVSSRYYFIGISQTNATKLYGVNATSGELDVELDMELEPNEYLNELEYDIDQGVFYALHRNNLGDMSFAQIDQNTGEIFDLLDISGNVQYFTPDASVYHQESGQFIMLTVSPSTILTIDADEASIIAQAPIDFYFIELEVDNVQYANAQFVSVEENEELIFSAFPNPSNDQLLLKGLSANEAYSFRLLSLSGQVIDKGSLDVYNSFQVSSYAPGTYLLEINSEKSTSTIRVHFSGR